MLRLKDHAEDEILDEEPELSDSITARDAFPEEDFGVDEEGDGEMRDRGTSLLRGLGIATATFVPTVLAILFGLPYLLDSAIPERAPSVIITPPTTSGSSPRETSPRSDIIREPFAAPRAQEPPARRPPDPRESAPRESARLAESLPESKTAEVPPRAVEPAPSTPTLPEGKARTIEPRAAEPREPERREPEPSRQTAAPRPAPEPSPAAESWKPGPDWAPAAAFTDRDAANRLASSIQQQGYPVEIRQDRSSTRPWVVWIGAEPRGGARRR